MTYLVMEYALVALFAGYSAWLVGINCRALRHPHPHGPLTRRRGRQSHR